MLALGRRETRTFNADPVDAVNDWSDIDYIGDGNRDQHLDVLAPKTGADGLPVYLYFHGGGWTSGDKKSLTKYCASQAANGMVVVNINYRKAMPFHMSHIMADANAALRWVVEHIEEFGGDPSRLVLGGDSAGGQIAALLAASTSTPELAEHYELVPPTPASSIRGVVQHCSAVDTSVMFEKGFIMGYGFLKMLLPDRGRGLALRAASRYLSPIEWLHAAFPPTLVTTSERDFFYRANLNFLRELRRQTVSVDTLIYGRAARNTRHTWQQDSRHPESQEVYRRLAAFVHRVTAVPQSLPLAAA